MSILKNRRVITIIIVEKFIKRVPEEYRKRWNIETGYRVKNEFKIWNCYRSYVVRTLFFVIRCIFHNFLNVLKRVGFGRIVIPP